MQCFSCIIPESLLLCVFHREIAGVPLSVMGQMDAGSWLVLQVLKIFVEGHSLPQCSQESPNILILSSTPLRQNVMTKAMKHVIFEI